MSNKRLFGFCVLSVAVNIVSLFVAGYIYYFYSNLVHGSCDTNVVNSIEYFSIRLIVTISSCVFLIKHYAKTTSVFYNVASSLSVKNRSSLFFKLIIVTLLYFIWYVCIGMFGYVLTFNKGVLINSIAFITYAVIQIVALLFMHVVFEEKDVRRANLFSGNRLRWFLFGILPISLTFVFASLDFFYAPVLAIVCFAFSKKGVFFENVIVFIWGTVGLSILTNVLVNEGVIRL